MATPATVAEVGVHLFGGMKPAIPTPVGFFRTITAFTPTRVQLNWAVKLAIVTVPFAVPSKAAGVLPTQNPPGSLYV